MSSVLNLPLILEVCVDRLASATAAIAGGADRIEVCGALDLGGITPSEGLLAACVERVRATSSHVVVMAMIRPHAGGFVYDADDVATMLRDIATAKRLGVDGVVFGALTAAREIDRETSRRLIAAARPLKVAFHRAFDHTADPLAAIDALIELGVERLLTSGQAATALAGAELIRQLVARAGDQLAIMPGGGVRPENVARLKALTGATEFHARALAPTKAHAADPLGISFPVRDAEPEVVAALVRAMRAVQHGGH